MTVPPPLSHAEGVVSVMLGQAQAATFHAPEPHRVIFEGLLPLQVGGTVFIWACPGEAQHISEEDAERFGAPHWRATVVVVAETGARFIGADIPASPDEFVGLQGRVEEVTVWSVPAATQFTVTQLQPLEGIDDFGERPVPPVLIGYLLERDDNQNPEYACSQKESGERPRTEE